MKGQLYKSWKAGTNKIKGKLNESYVDYFYYHKGRVEEKATCMIAKYMPEKKWKDW